MDLVTRVLDVKSAEMGKPSSLGRWLSPRLRSNADEVTRKLASLDSVDLKSIFTDRAHVMRSIPFITKGAFRCALRTALEEVISSIERPL